MNLQLTELYSVHDVRSKTLEIRNEKAIKKKKRWAGYNIIIHRQNERTASNGSH